MWNRRSVIGAIGIGAFVGLAGPAISQETYIPLISKGFQHQFWQAVKVGAEQAAKDLNVRITFEGPTARPWSTSRSTCSRRRLPRTRRRSASPPSTARRRSPCCGRRKPPRSPSSPSTRASTATSRSRPRRRTTSLRRGACGRQARRTHRRRGRHRRRGSRPDEPHRIDRRDGFVNRIKEKHPKINIVSRPVRQRRPPEVDRDHQVDPPGQPAASRACSAPTRVRRSASSTAPRS